MSTMTLLVILGAIASTIIFVAGFARGMANAINGYRAPAGKEAPVPQDGHWGGIALAFTLSIIVIAGIGFSPAFVYAGPILVLVTTVGVGIAFFVEKKVPPHRA